MSVWYKVKWIPPLFAAFDAAFPQRTKGSDGTIGDPAHQTQVSGHNPDDTPGVKAERQDSDSVPEVRAADVTSDLRAAKMYDVVQSVLATPDELICLIYIICDGWIWRKSNGWVRETYTGSDKHFGHAHFSGDPAYDEFACPWNSIRRFGEDMNADQDRKLTNIHQLVEALVRMHPLAQGVVIEGYSDATNRAEMAAVVSLNGIQATVNSLAVTSVDEDALAQSIADKVIAADTNALTDADKPVITAAVKDALREGTA